MDKTNSIVESLSKVIIDTVYRIGEKLPYDKSTEGVIVGIEEDKYTVNAFGKTYTVYSSYDFELNQTVIVTAPQNNFKRLNIRPK